MAGPGDRGALNVRRATDEDWVEIWEIFREVIASGDTYVFNLDMGEVEARHIWMSGGTRTYVAEDSTGIVGTYILKANQPGLGSHVANAAFMVSKVARGKGVGRGLGEHAIEEARRLDYRGMQFNCVVRTNLPAIRLWESLGFAIVGTIPGAFNHRESGYMDMHVMYRDL